MQTQTRFWYALDNVAYSVGRAVRHGNGNIRTLLACCALVAMFIYPLANM